MKRKIWQMAGRALAALLAVSALLAMPGAALAETVSIGSAADLRAFAVRVNNGEGDLDAELTADIVWNASADGQWSSIGKWVTNVPYTGVFDGQGYKISGLYANYLNASSLALFNEIGAAGVVRDLVLDVDFTTYGNVAGVAVNNAGTIEYVTVYGSIASAAGASATGGIVAACLDEGSMISHCVNSASVTGSTFSNSMGGIVGTLVGTVKYCANYGTVINSYASGGGATGGLVGRSTGNAKKYIFFSYNAGAVKAPNLIQNNNDLGLGGLVGALAANNSLTIVNSFNYGKARTKDEVPGTVIGGSGVGSSKAVITHFANVFYLKASGGSLFQSGAGGNGTDGWGAEADGATDKIKDKIIERTASEFSGGDLLALLDTPPGLASAAYAHYEEGAWTQFADYPVLVEIQMPDRGKSAINAVIAEAEGLLSGPYTVASLAAMTSVLSAARDVAYDESLSLTQPEIDEAANALLEAIATLEPVETVKIGSAGDLAAFAARVNAGESRLRGRLVADIVVESQWSAIGAAQPPIEYEGVFDGCGHTITLKAADVNVFYLGFFHTIGAQGVVKNLALDVDFIGNIYVGGVAGLNKGRIERVSVYGSITSASSYAGGIAGSAENSVISRCVNYANVSAYGISGTGGIAGLLSGTGTVEYSANYGRVECAHATATAIQGTGGIIGNTSGNGHKISNCYNAGGIALLISNNGNGLGGLLGRASLNANSILVNCFNYGGVTYQNGGPSSGGAIISGGAAASNTTVNAANVSDIYYLEGSGEKLFYGSAGAESLDGDKFLEQTAEEFADGTVLASLESGSGGADEWEQGTDHPVLKDIGAGDVAASSLAASIADAEAKLAAAVEGTAHGQYPAGSKDAFQNAIDGAKSVLSAPNPSQEDLEGAIADLSAAETAFDGSKIGTDGRGNENTLGGGGCNAAGVSALPLLALLGVVLRKKRWQKAD